AVVTDAGTGGAGRPARASLVPVALTRACAAEARRNAWGRGRGRTGETAGQVTRGRTAAARSSSLAGQSGGSSTGTTTNFGAPTAGNRCSGRRRPSTPEGTTSRGSKSGRRELTTAAAAGGSSPRT